MRPHGLTLDVTNVVLVHEFALDSPKYAGGPQKFSLLLQVVPGVLNCPVEVGYVNVKVNAFGTSNVLLSQVREVHCPGEVLDIQIKIAEVVCPDPLLRALLVPSHLDSPFQNEGLASGKNAATHDQSLSYRYTL
ncbi:MAG: hypothetical protein HYX68_16715 [Planctomycetes bacterium]|nr:hypothetical protein [Planctomycetota bacterium]